ncbi:MAG: hypothetical protein ACQESJ_09230 [Bacteroidota bacterium]
MNRYLSVITIIILLFLSASVSSQNSCGEQLKHAEELYESGQISKVEEFIKPCLDDGFSKNEKVRAYRLLTLSNLYYNEDEKAVDAMDNLLKTESEYKIKSSDPSEFVSLYDAFRTKPVIIAGIKSSFGFFEIYDIQNYNDINSFQHSAVYQPANSASIGVSLEFRVFWQISFVSEVYYSMFNYKYQNTVLDYSNIAFSENIQSLDMPLNIQWNVMEADFTPYVNLGASFNYLISSQTDFSREDITDETTREPVNTKLNVTNSRNKYNYAFCAGVGFRWKNLFGQGYLSFDIRYSRYLNHNVEAANRAENPELIYSYFNTDNPLKFQNTQILIGYKLPIYFPKYQKR